MICYSVITENKLSKIVKFEKNSFGTFNIKSGIILTSEKAAWDLAIILNKTKGKINIFEIKFQEKEEIYFEYIPAGDIGEALSKSKLKEVYSVILGIRRVSI